MPSMTSSYYYDTSWWSVALVEQGGAVKAEQRQSGNRKPEIDWRAEVNALGESVQGARSEDRALSIDWPAEVNALGNRKGFGAFESAAILLASGLALFPVLFIVTTVVGLSELWSGVVLVTIATMVTVGWASFRLIRCGHARS